MSKFIIGRHESQRAELAEQQAEEIAVADRLSPELDAIETSLARIVAKADDPFEKDHVRRFAAETRNRIYTFVKNLTRMGDESPF